MSTRKDDAHKAPRAPKPQIEMGSEDSRDSQTSSPFDAAWNAVGDVARNAAESEDLHEAVGFVKGLGAAAWRYAHSHPYTVFYGVVGLVLAVLILTLGLWDTIVIAVFAIVGAMIGQIRDGDNSIVNFFRRMLGGRR